MEFLYKSIDGKQWYYEVFVVDSTLIEHRGIVGDVGCVYERRIPRRCRKQLVENALLATQADGYSAMDKENREVLLVEYAVDGFGTDEDLEKRHALQQRLGDLLVCRGLGVCDGGSAGAGTMEACCFVIDFLQAKRVIEADLAETKFADYTRIYREET